MKTILGAVCYLLIQSVGVGLALYITGNSDWACRVWAGSIITGFVVGPLIASWPKQSKRLPGGPWTAEEQIAMAEFRKKHPDTSR